MNGKLLGALNLSAIGIMVTLSTVSAADTSTPGTESPTAADPFPIMAAGWGPEVGEGLFLSRWAEDWTGMRAAGNSPPLKAMPIGSEASLTLSAEARIRYDAYDNKQLKSGQDNQEGLFRGILGSDLRLNRNFRIYSEVGTGQVDRHRDLARANFQNDASLQQLFLDARGQFDSNLVGTMIGRQEFADGPRQLISVSDGPNLHRSWNGVRVYAHDPRYRVGAFDLRATKQERGVFDEHMEGNERVQGLNASFMISSSDGPNIYLDPFWIKSRNPAFRSGGLTGLDERSTYGARAWGRAGEIRFDWTLAHQAGKFLQRDIDAWGLFAMHSFALGNEGWKPSVMMRFDIATGGGAYGGGTLRGFNPLYASSNYLGEGQFLSLSNILLISPGLALSPAPDVKVSMEYGRARRLQEDDAVYAGGMRAYEGTESVSGKSVGGLLRIHGNWKVMNHCSVFVVYEHLGVSEVLDRAQFPSGSYGQVGTSYRY
jgi:hypothetical protein